MYWYTVELGWCSKAMGCASTGPGLCPRRPNRSLPWRATRPTVSGFDLDRVLRTQYRIDDFQEIYFVLPDLADLLNLARIDFKPHYERVRGHQAICQVLSSRVIRC